MVVFFFFFHFCFYRCKREKTKKKIQNSRNSFLCANFLLLHFLVSFPFHTQKCVLSQFKWLSVMATVGYLPERLWVKLSSDDKIDLQVIWRLDNRQKIYRFVDRIVKPFLLHLITFTLVFQYGGMVKMSNFLLFFRFYINERSWNANAFFFFSNH